MTTDLRALDYTLRILGMVFEMQVISVLLQTPYSFDQLLSIRLYPSPRDLTVCLAKLEQRGVIERSSSIYQLTPTGESL